MSIILYFVLGIFAGVLSGLLGIGGGTVIIPALVYILGYSQHKAQGTSLVALLLPVGLLGVIKYYKEGDVNLVMGLIIAFGLFIGAYFGALIAVKVPDVLLKRIFGVFFLILALRMLIGK